MINKIFSWARSCRTNLFDLNLILILILTFLTVLSILFLDNYIFLMLLQHPLKIDRFFKGLIQLGKIWVPVWLLLLWFYTTSRLKGTLIVLLALLLVVPAVLSIKCVVRRPRPRDIIKSDWTQENRRNPFQSWSFPSGDTASVFAMATVFAGFIKRYWKPMLFATSGGVGFLRVAVLAHYPSDVFAGAAIGIFCGWLAVKIAGRSMSFELMNLESFRKVAFGCLAIMPLLIWFVEGPEEFLIFIKMFFLPAGVLYLIVQAIVRFERRKKIMKS